MFTVYNRWGELIFSSEKPTEGWNGLSKGKNQPNDTYVYMLQVRTIDNKTEIRKDTFVLLR